MAEGEERKSFFRGSSASFGLCLRSGGAKIKTSHLRKRKLSLVFFFFLTFLVVFVVVCVYKQAVTSKTPRSRKTKRHLKAEMLDRQEDNNFSVEDVQIVPENFDPYFNDDKINQNPNHRYTDAEPGQVQQNLVQTLQERRDWAHYPTEQVNPGANVERKRKFMSGPVRGLVPYMRVKGIFTEEREKGNREDEKLSHPKEINNLMQKELNLEAKGGRRNQDKAFGTPGAPFQLPSKEKRRKASKPLTPHQSQRTRPLTIYLDFYPMKQQEGHFKRRKLVRKEKLSPLRGGNGILLKLNLHPRGRELEEIQGRTFKGRQRAHLLRYDKKAERKSLGWFSKSKEKKKSQWKQCSSVLGLSPHGKRITAKWKDKNGDWIHAERVQVKYLKGRSD